MPIFPLSGTTDKRGFSYSIYHSAPDGSDPVTVVQDRAGLAGEIWYLAAEGYILAYHYTERGDEARYLRYDLDDGSVMTVVEDEWIGANERVEVLPSPDGTFLVRLLPTAWCPDTQDFRMDCSYSIEYLTGDSFPHEARVAFYASASLQVLEQEVGRFESVVPFDEYVTGAFMADGGYVVSDGSIAWSFNPGQAPVQLSAPPAWECMYPPTASSTVNQLGQVLIIDDNGQGFMVQEGIPGEDSSFGCADTVE